MTEPNLASYYDVRLSGMLPSMRYAWAMALKKNGYRQGSSQLRNSDNEFCCLGVLCDISNVGKWSTWLNHSGNYYYEVSEFRAGINKMSHTGDYGDDAYYNTESLPMILRDYWDMTEEEEQKLIMLNDGNEAEGMYPLTFDEIADIIIDSLLSDGYDLDQLEAQYEADK